VSKPDLKGCGAQTNAQPMIPFFAELPPCVVAIEASSSAHHWGETLIAFGHEVRSLPLAHVKPYVRRNKNDPLDAAAICGPKVPTRTQRFKFGTLAAHARVSERRPADRSGWSWSSIAHKRSDIEPASAKGRMP
jgi:transposase